MRPALDLLARAIASSWDEQTAYLGGRKDNPAAGQCYPTARLVQWFYPEAEIVSGQVDTGAGIEHHFWNSLNGHRVDLSWSQFPAASTILSSKILDREALNDSPPTVVRCDLLRQRVLHRLAEVGQA